MKKPALSVIIMPIFAAFALLGSAVEDRMKDSLETKNGPIEIELLGHASLRLQMGGKLVYVDPVMDFYHQEDFGKADLILVTHSHQDHFQADLIDRLKSETAVVYLAVDCQAKYPRGKSLANGQETVVDGILVQAVPAYNIEHRRGDGTPFHPQGQGNGYLIVFAGARLYVAGDTELVPEMDKLAGVDALFLPANLPYTMSAAMFVKAVELLKPKKIYPYHYRFGTSILADILPVLRQRNFDVRVATDRP